jgi:hypothetical protein
MTKARLKTGPSVFRRPFLSPHPLPGGERKNFGTSMGQMKISITIFLVILNKAKNLFRFDEHGNPDT